MAYLELRSVSIGFGSGLARTEALKDISLTVEEGEFIAIVGYSGVGKTTLMNLIAGLAFPDSGEVLVDGKRVDGPSADRGLVFQNYSLLPWLSVRDNVAMAVDTVFAEEDPAARSARIESAVRMVNLSSAMEKRPAELSGGMRQRVALARTLSTKPSLMLLDEPLSALDALTRSVLQDQILEIWEQEKQTVLLVTNDVDEGLYMADRIIPLSLGPGASFGPEVRIDLPRPRDAKALSHDAHFRELRRQVITYLTDIREEQHKGEEAAEMELPDVQPMNITDIRPTAFRGQPARPNRRIARTST